MSGAAGADRVKSRQDFKQFLASYQHVLSKFPGFVSMTPSGSYNSNPDKQDFGDIDLIVHIQSDKDKATVKKELQAFFTKMPETVIVPFSSAKHAGKRTYNAGELVSVRYHDDALGYSAQVDNIVALDASEASFKQSFLDMPAEEQGLILGLVKIATIETDPALLFQKLGIKVVEPLEENQEYEFNLSGVELQLRKVSYEPGTFKQVDRKVLWSSKNFDDVQKLLYQYDLKAGFNDLLQQCKRNIRNPRSGERMKGVFASMISVKSGEVGTAKGAGKEAALAKIQQTFAEGRSVFRALMENGNRKVVFAFGRFQPPTIGHELLIMAVKNIAEQQGADHIIYVSKTQDSKQNPLSVEEKIAYLRKMFPGINFVACDATVRTPIEAAKHLNAKYQELIMVAGSDRVASFTKLLNDYNGKEYNYAMLRVVSAGDRDPDSDQAAGMSGTRMRAAAVAGDFQTFMSGLPGTISEQDAMHLMELIQKGLQKPVKATKGVAEDISKEDINELFGLLGKPTPKKIVKPDAYADRLEIARRERGIKNPYFQNLLNKHKSGGKLTDYEKKDLGRWMAANKAALEDHSELSELHHVISRPRMRVDTKWYNIMYDTPDGKTVQLTSKAPIKDEKVEAAREFFVNAYAERGVKLNPLKMWAKLASAPSVIPASENNNQGGSYAAHKPGYSGEGSYTAQPNWRGMNIGEDVELAMAEAIARLIESQLR